eukprot:Selendium_serpulae@DN1135_c0_g1_i1.p1
MALITRLAPLLVVLLSLHLRRASCKSNTEVQIVARHCTDGKAEFLLPDKTRVDCLTAAVAWEYDFSEKWAECLGQALHYAAATGRQGGCTLICKAKRKQTCEIHLARLNNAIRYHHLYITTRMIFEASSKSVVASHRDAGRQDLKRSDELLMFPDEMSDE